MEHIVRYRAPDGQEVTREASSLDEALALVEKLCNEDGISQVRVYQRIEVQFQTYYRATVAAGSARPEPSAAPPATSDEPGAETPEPPPEPPPGAMLLSPSPRSTAAEHAEGAESEDADGDQQQGRRTLFSRG